MSHMHDNDDNRAVNEPGDESDDLGIQELLDIGYEQLDSFVEWLEQELNLDTRSAQQDCFNAESFVDYLANHQQKAAKDTNEYDLRWFIFSHYIRKSIADRESQIRAPDSLMRFFQFLHAKYGMELPDWIAATLQDTSFFRQRLSALLALASEDEEEWKAGFREWCEELEQDLDMRCLWLPDDMGEGMVWADTMGWREAALRNDANRLWQRERAELLATGLSFDAVRDRLVASCLIWLDTPQERLEGVSPRLTIRGERAEQAMGIDEDDGTIDEM